MVGSRLKDSNVFTVIQFVVAGLFPVVTMGLGWTANALVDHEVRLSRIEANRYTAADAHADNHKLYSELQELQHMLTQLAAAMPKEVPPQWFRAQVDELRQEVAKMREELRNLVQAQSRR